MRDYLQTIPNLPQATLFLIVEFPPPKKKTPEQQSYIVICHCQSYNKLSITVVIHAISVVLSLKGSVGHDDTKQEVRIHI